MAVKQGKIYRKQGVCAVEKQTMGTIVSAAKQWWLKVNNKPMRTHALDGAVFPYIIKVKYTVDGKDFTCRKWINAGNRTPAQGSAVKVFYEEDRPAKARIAI